MLLTLINIYISHIDIKVLVFGHSYVRDLESLNCKHINIDQRPVDIEYLSFPGADYDTFIEKPTLLQKVSSHNPDFIVVILGGNSIKRDLSNFELFHKCRTFYNLLRDTIPSTTIISAQVELRFYETPNRFGAPSLELYRKKRNELNKFLNRLKKKDYMLIIAGPGRLDHETYYKDSVHLNKSGLRVYLAILKSTVSYAVQKNKSKDGIVGRK